MREENEWSGDQSSVLTVSGLVERTGGARCLIVIVPHSSSPELRSISLLHHRRISERQHPWKFTKTTLISLLLWQTGCRYWMLLRSYTEKKWIHRVIRQKKICFVWLKSNYKPTTENRTFLFQDQEKASELASLLRQKGVKQRGVVRLEIVLLDSVFQAQQLAWNQRNLGLLLSLR